MSNKEKILKKKEDEKVRLKREEDLEKLKKREINQKSCINKTIIIGTLEQSPKFLQENEYIKKGYVINCNSFENALRCLFRLHNETMNTWTHLLGAIFFFFLIFYTIFFITNFTIQLNIIKKDYLPSLEKNAVLLYELSPLTMNNFFESIKNIEKDFDGFNQKIIYKETINNIYSLKNKLYDNISYKISLILEQSKSFLESLSLLKKEIVNLINLDESRNSHLESYLDSEIRREIKERPKKKLARFPLYIIIICALLCLSFSASYHALKIISPIYHKISHRFDHGGISILIFIILLRHLYNKIKKNSKYDSKC